MNKERLAIQIDVLRRVAEQKLPFNMDGWVMPGDEPCQTACCAFGWAALDPRLQAEGLRLRVRESVGATNLAPASVKTLLTSVSASSLATATPSYAGELGFRAAALFYGISRDAASYLFDPKAYHWNAISPDHVIERIERVIAHDGEAQD